MEMIKGRKSVRTFDGNMLTDQHRKDIEEYIKEITNPFNIPVEFVLLDAKEHNPAPLSSYEAAGILRDLFAERREDFTGHRFITNEELDYPF